MSCPDCGDSGRVCITVVCAERKLVKRGRDFASEPTLCARYEAARCDCREGGNFPNYMDRMALVETMRGPVGLARHPSAVVVVDLGRPYGERFAGGLAEVWTSGPVTHEQRQHAFRAARSAPTVQAPEIVLDAGPEPRAVESAARRQTLRERPDAESYETERVWA